MTRKDTGIDAAGGGRERVECAQAEAAAVLEWEGCISGVYAECVCDVVCVSVYVLCTGGRDEWDGEDE